MQCQLRGSLVTATLETWLQHLLFALQKEKAAMVAGFGLGAAIAGGCRCNNQCSGRKKRLRGWRILQFLRLCTHELATPPALTPKWQLRQFVREASKPFRSMRYRYVFFWLPILTVFIQQHGSPPKKLPSETPMLRTQVCSSCWCSHCRRRHEPDFTGWPGH